MLLSAKKSYAEASAPGRLDVMGGIADYSGSLVLQTTIKQKTFVKLTLRNDFKCHVTSKIGGNELLKAEVDYHHYLSEGTVDIEFARTKFQENTNQHWLSYIIGCALLLQKELRIDFRGANFELHSDVPLGKGVSSSASVEVACMKALAEAFDISFSGTQLPILAQQVENKIVGAPCGLMDQLASYLGESNKLLPILCQPDVIGSAIPIPDDITFVGIDSGVRHSVAGASYSDVRCAAFMGYTILALQAGASTDQILLARKGGVNTNLPYHGYLSNIGVQEYETMFRDHLPVTMNGAEFMRKFKYSLDKVTQIDSQSNYAIRTCASHPIYENERVAQFKNLLSVLQTLTGPERAIRFSEMGRLMYESHQSYSACGLGSEQTDEIVALAKTEEGIYGAKITGGGNGGTVCLLVKRSHIDAANRIHQRMCERYKKELVRFDL